MNEIETIIFDLGGVLIDGNPKYLYRKVFNGDEEKVDWFLNNICTSDWNLEHDAGRTLKEGTQLLLDQYPEYEDLIRVYYDRWEEMIGGAINDSVSVLTALKQTNKYQLYALTNWSAETFPVALERFDFLQTFEGIVVSGEERTRKPYPKIYEILLERYQINPAKSVFIDDNLENVLAAQKIGINGIHFKNAIQLMREFNAMNILI